MNALARVGRAYCRENVRAFAAIKAAVERDLPSALSIAAVAWVASFLAAGFQTAALIVAAGSLTTQLLRLVLDR
ncbi:hypothetical protein ACIREK_30615 [Streptomyces sp. NPDC102415]|uniref:hypothetical protein n=1 Tax=Streptomyces sp. NPDC102415 TaxID=3366173 RepID=UPI0038058F19